MGEMRVMGLQGDTKLSWDSKNKDEVKAARKLYKKLAEAGYKAFSVGGDYKPGNMLDDFDPDIEKIVFVPPMRGG